ncbi:YtcA family lipoprotein [Desulfovibrio litoralis]|uniref:Uncharacterized protein YtcA n=1 Tax=Desulfovibrio litoralis DSM 11393 TaxID=1121455 RepID=A0A1M7T4G7_9BACT|nr:Uncharacterised protein family protein [Desulfovibrio litoralis DSM 11393]
MNIIKRLKTTAKNLKINFLQSKKYIILCVSLICLGGCNLAPTQNFFGSFFPAWLYCIVFGIIATALSRKLLIFLKIDQYLKMRVLVYFAMALAYIFLAWLLVFTDILTQFVF